MEAEFWHERWRENRLGFHQSDYNALMVGQFDRLDLAQGARVFVPLCGKTRDIAWLLSRGYRVAGAELSGLAIDQLFDDLGITPNVSDRGALELCTGPGLDIFVGDIFELDRETLGPVDAVYDRAALVALPHEMRSRYADHLHHITRGVPQFLLTFEYDQSAMDGPPFSVDENEVARVYGRHYRLDPLAEREVEGGLKGVVAARERGWHLH